jgi:hypothetical protein
MWLPHVSTTQALVNKHFFLGISDAVPRRLLLQAGSNTMYYDYNDGKQHLLVQGALTLLFSSSSSPFSNCSIALLIGMS